MIIDIHGLLSLTIDDLLGHMVAVLGMTGSGKSNTVAVLVENLLAANIPVCVVDPAGEYYGLKERFEILAIGKGRSPQHPVDTIVTPDEAHHAAKVSYTQASSVILDLSGYNKEARQWFITNYMEALWNIAPVHQYPYIIVLEEAHNFIPQRGRATCTEVLTDIACEGRKQGLGMIMSSQRSARLNKDVVTQAGLAFLHFVRHPADLDVYYDIIPRPRHKVKDYVSRLKTGEALVLHGAEVQRRTIRVRQTPHGGHTPTINDLPTKRGAKAEDYFVQKPLLELSPTHTKTKR